MENQNKELVKFQHRWYEFTPALYEIVKCLKNRELALLNSKLEDKHIATRFLYASSVNYLKMHLKELGVTRGEKLINLYRSNATLKENSIPVTTYNLQKRTKDKDYIEFNKNFGNYITGFDLIIDIDADTIMKSHKIAKQIKKFYDDNKLPYFIQFSVIGDTPVLIKEGNNIKLIPIKNAIDLFKDKKEISILSLDKNYKTKFSKIYDCLEHTDKIYKIYHQLSKTPIQTTKHHSIYTLQEKGICEKKVKELNIGDYLITFNKKNNLKPKKNVDIEYILRGKQIREKITLTNDLLKLIGYYLKDGHLSVNSQVGFSFNKKETHYQKEVKSILKKLTHTNFYEKENKRLRKLKKSGVKRKKILQSSILSEAFIENAIYNKKKSNTKKISPHKSNPNDNSIQITFNSIKWYSFFKKLCGKGAKNKHLPSFVYQLSKNQVLNLLKGYINSDGYKKNKYHYQIKSVSKRLIVELIWLLKLNEISCTLYKENNKPHKLPQGTLFKGSLIYMITIPKRELNERKLNKFSHFPTEKTIPTKWLKKVYKQTKPKNFNYHRNEQTTFSKKLANRNRISKVIEWIEEHHSIKPNIQSKKILKLYKKLINSEVGFLKVKKIEKSNSGKVYDVSVKKTENFFGGDFPILLHNSGTRGFHIIIPAKYIKTTDIKRHEVTLKALISTFGFKEIDISTLNPKGLIKIPYSFDAGNIALPLSDSEFDEFTPEYVKFENVMRNIKIKQRGLLLRNHNLSFEQLQENVSHFIG